MSLKEISDKLGTNKDNAYDVLTRIEDILEAQESRAEKADRGKMRDLEKQIEAAQKKQRSGNTSSSASGVTYSSPSGILGTPLVRRSTSPRHWSASGRSRATLKDIALKRVAIWSSSVNHFASRAGDHQLI